MNYNSIAERIKDGSILKIKPMIQDKIKELRYFANLMKM